MPNVTNISRVGLAALLVGSTWVGTLDILTNLDENPAQPSHADNDRALYTVEASTAQSEIVYKNGLSIWSDIDFDTGAEYEIELWGSNIAPKITQIKSMSISKTKG